MTKNKTLAVEIPEGKVDANPTKNFFVHMLTRDIVLMDAIMDLIDNCIDGVHREVKKNPSNQNDNIAYMYKGYHADIILNEKEFSIRDNCGGIPLSVARNYAFKMGRSDDYHDDDHLETLGMYGIGMKRAIFKMGLESEVTTWNQQSYFTVTIPKDWTSRPEWYFDYKLINKSAIKNLLKEPGTYLCVKNLHPNIKPQFKDKSGFVKDLAIALKNHYGYIIQQGFKITLNGIKIEPIELNILTHDLPIQKKQTIRPYIYAGNVGDVDIEIVIGFYRPPATDEEIQKELEGGYAKSLSENAGITILCNDRVVLYCDKTFLTGWGDNPVPKYHTQFIAIAGVVHFRSNTPINLPVTTTKRGLDTSSQVYATAKNKIKEGLKIFTNFTNHWKANTEERAELFRPEKIKKLNALSPGASKSKFVKLEPRRGDSTSKYQVPDLPKPQTRQPLGMINISFSREKDKISKIQDYFFSDKIKSPNEIGGWCFDQIYSQVD
jgi:hypothetical protein